MHSASQKIDQLKPGLSQSTASVFAASGSGDSRTLPRTGLISRILDQDRQALVLIGAAPGFGKSVLLRQLGRALGKQGYPWASFTAGGGDPCEITLCTQLLQAIATAADLGIPGESALEVLLGQEDTPDLLSQSAFTLLIDDYQHVRSVFSDALLARLLSTLPQGSRIIAVGRFSPSDVNLPALKLNEADLRFNEMEMTELQRALLVTASVQLGSLLMAGWPAGARIVCRHATTKAIPPESMRRRITADAGAYLDRHVPSELRPIVNALALIPERVLVTEHIDDLCKASPEALGRLSDLGLLESGEEGVRLKSPFRDIIHDRFADQEPERYRMGCQAIIGKLIGQHRWNEARDVFQRCPPAHALNVLELNGGWMLDVRYGPDLVGSFNADLSGNLSAFPRLELLHIVSLARAGFNDEAQAQFERICARDAIISHDPMRAAELAIIAVRLAIFADHGVDVELTDRLERQMKSDLSSDPALYAIAADVLCDAYYRTGHYQQSREAGLRGLVLSEHYSVPFAGAYVFALSAMSEYRLGNLPQAVDLVERMTVHVRNWFPLSSTLNDAAAIIMAVMRYEQGRFDEAEALLDRPLDVVLHKEGWAELCVAGFMTAANVALLQQGCEPALEIVARAEAAGARMGFQRLVKLARCRALFILVKANRKDEAGQLATGDSFPVTSDATGNDTWRDYVCVSEILALNSLRLADGQERESLADFGRYLGARGVVQNVPVYLRVSCLKLQALCAISRDACEEIATTLRMIYLHAEKRGYVGGLAEIGGLEQVLEACAKRTDLPSDVRPLADRLASRCKTLTSGHRNQPTALSPRQNQILSLLVDGLSNKEIARKLELAEGTVKSYRKTLYQKLDISRRSQAIERARALS